MKMEGAGGFFRWRLFFQRQGRKPGSVFKSAIYLRNLPPGIGRAALVCQYIWSCRPCRRTRPASLTAVVGSYPAFSPLPVLPKKRGDRYFRRLFSVTDRIRLLPSALSAAGCPALSGLSSPQVARQIVLPLYSAAKIRIFLKYVSRVMPGLTGHLNLLAEEEKVGGPGERDVVCVANRLEGGVLYQTVFADVADDFETGVLNRAVVFDMAECPEG